jgi:GTP pyrophosphokinase
VSLGREQLHKVVDRFALDVEEFSALAKRLGYQNEQELFRDVGGCDLPMERVLPELLRAYGEPQFPQICVNGASSIPVTGVGSLNKSFASCCLPQSGDDIVGYILASDHTVEVHRSDCSVFLDKMTGDRTRFVGAKWGQVCETYLACMGIHAHDRPFLLRDLWNIISEVGLNVADVDVQVNRAKDATITVCIDVENWIQFNSVLVRIEDLPGTISVRRKVSPDGSSSDPAGRGGL